MTTIEVKEKTKKEINYRKNKEEKREMLKEHIKVLDNGLNII